MNATQRLVAMMARECVKARVEEPSVIVPQPILDLLERELIEGMFVIGDVSGAPSSSIKFCGVTFKVR